MEVKKNKDRNILKRIRYSRDRIKRYHQEYEWSDIFAMARNQKLDPEICNDDFNDRLVVITGATSGIGYLAAKKFASHGADILCINRNEKKSKQLCEDLRAAYHIQCDYLIADFSNLQQIHAVARKLSGWNRDIDVLIHNAGLYMTRKALTPDNLEMVFQTNYLSSFILNYYLKDKFVKQNHGRIIFVNSEAHRFAVWGLHLDDLSWDHHSYSGAKSYGSAKLAQLLSMVKLNDYLAGSGATVNAMHPGNIKTNSGQNNGPLYKFLKKLLVDRTARDGEIAAEALYFLGVSGKMRDTSGKFFNLTTEEVPAPPALDRWAAETLWEKSLEFSGLEK